MLTSAIFFAGLCALVAAQDGTSTMPSAAEQSSINAAAYDAATSAMVRPPHSHLFTKS